MRCIKNSRQREMGETWSCVCVYSALNTVSRGLATIAISFSIQARGRETEKAQQCALPSNGSVPLTGSAFTPATDLAYTLIE